MKFGLLAVGLLTAAGGLPGSSSFQPRPSCSAGVFSRSQFNRLQAVETDGVIELAVVAEEQDGTPPTTSEKKREFENKGRLFSWIPMYLELFGMTEGKSLNYAIPLNVDESRRSSPAESARLKKEAAENLQNIGIDERNRRAEAAKIFAAISILYAGWAGIIVDDGDLIGHIVRFGVVFPLFFAEGMRRSAESGL